MEQITKVVKEVDVIDSFVCDKCEKEFHIHTDDLSEAYEVSEMLHIRMEGGFGSIFGDGVKIEGDFCQTCVNTLLGKYLRYIS